MSIANCNDCCTNDCRKYDTISDSSNCKTYTPHRPFTQPILLHLLLGGQRKVDATVKLLNEIGLTIRERGRYPYFDLVLR